MKGSWSRPTEYFSGGRRPTASLQHASEWILRLLLSSCLFIRERKYKYSNNNDNERYQIFLAKQGKWKGGWANLRIHSLVYWSEAFGLRPPLKYSLLHLPNWKFLLLLSPLFPQWTLLNLLSLKKTISKLLLQSKLNHRWAVGSRLGCGNSRTKRKMHGSSLPTSQQPWEWPLTAGEKDQLFQSYYMSMLWSNICIITALMGWILDELDYFSILSRYMPKKDKVDLRR
jgi:hypothetical protein